MGVVLRTRSLVFLIVALSAAPTTLPSRAAGTNLTPGCSEVVASPNFHSDRLAYCTNLNSDGTALQLTLLATHDGGRSWSHCRAAGLTWGATSFVANPRFSPRFDADHAFFMPTNSGLFRTIDGCATFTLVDSNARNPQLDAPGFYYGSTGSLAPALGPSRTFAALPGPAAARIDLQTGLHQPVAGSPGASTMQFLTPNQSAPVGPVFAVSSEQPDPSQSAVRRVLWRCDADLTCAERLYSFPLNTLPVRFWRLPDSGGRFRLAALATRHDGRATTFISTDGGVTFTAWTSVNTLLEATQRYGKTPRVSVAANSNLPGRVFLRIVGSPNAGLSWAQLAPPGQQLFRSDDGGMHWSRVGFQRGLGQAGTSGNLPWNTNYYGIVPDPAAITLTSDGRLLVPAMRVDLSGRSPDTAGVFCSLDGGRRWSQFCSR